MTYALLLWPHANWRYEEAARRPAEAELDTILSAVGLRTQCHYAPISGADALLFDAQALAPGQADAISGHSLQYWFGVWSDDKTFEPLFGAPNACLGSDLAAIQKYKGKTNERFTQMLINMALYSGDSLFNKSGLKLLDPMCGRGTTLFQAVNRGWDAFGLDIDKKDVGECAKFFEKYLQYRRVKHKYTKASQTLPGKVHIMLNRLAFACGRCNSEHSLTVACADAELAARAYGKNAFHLIVCDLPYGVQHAPGGEHALERSLNAWREALMPGGAIAVSYNTHTLKTERVRELMDMSGLRALRGGAYERMAHWVEQAVTRDISVCVKQ